MTTYFVSRHRGAIDWLADRNISAVTVEHIDPVELSAGDVVLGTLPIHLVARLTARGIRYFHLELVVPRELRGIELTAAQMQDCGAQLMEYRADRLELFDLKG